MEGQPVPCKPLGQHVQHLFRILPILKAQYGVIGVADEKHLATKPRPHHVLDPLIELKVKVHVGEEGADDLPLPRSRLAHQQASVVTDSDVDPLPYQSEDAPIAYPLPDHLHELLSHNRVEVGGNVQLKNARRRLTTQHSSDFAQRVLCTASRAEPVGAVQKVLLVDGREHLDRRLLQNLILEGGNRNWSRFSVLFGNV